MCLKADGEKLEEKGTLEDQAKESGFQRTV